MRWLLTGPLGLILLIVALGWFTSLDVADLRRPRPGEGNPQITLLDREGVAFASFGNRYGDYLSLDQMSPWLPKAVVAIEDRRFYQHPGLDPIGIARALVQNLKAGHVVQGGSTISQQLAKLAFLTPERSLARKLKEALYTIWIEARFGKNEILEAYLNRVYLGSGAYGVDAAARRYFAKPASELSLAEAALLAGVVKAPSYYAPTRDLALARQRAAVVLDAMVESGAASAEQAAEAKAHPARLAIPPIRTDTGYFADWVAAESRLYAEGDQPRLTVHTTLDRRLQQAAEEAVQSTFARVGGKTQQAALVAMSPDGEVRAMLGGRSYAASQFNRATQAERQPGSAFKLFVYLAALEDGLRPEDVISAAPIEVDGWQPRNDQGRLSARDHARRRLCPVGQHRGGAPQRAGRAQEGDPRRRAPRHHLGVARRPEPGARQLRGAPARADRRLRLDRQRRPPGLAGGDHRDRGRRRQAALRAACRSTSRCWSLRRCAR